MSQLIDLDSEELSDDVDFVPDSQPLADIIVTPPVVSKKIDDKEHVPVTMKMNLNESFDVVAPVEGKKRSRKVKIENE
jgi:hypothetical protein